MRGRILVIDHKTPAPDEDSGSACAFVHLQLLAQAGFEITFAPLDLADRGRHTRALAVAGVRTVASPEWISLASVIEALGAQSDVVMLYRAPVAEQLFDFVRWVAPSTPILFHTVDLHFLRMEREAAVTNDAEWLEMARQARAIELGLLARADASIVVSEHELSLVRTLLPAIDVRHIPLLREVPERSRRAKAHWAVRRLCGRLGLPGHWLNRLDLARQKRDDLLFLGGFEHTPNVDAVSWFVSEVWPLLQRRGFPHRLIIAGSKLPKSIAELASDRIEARGYVEDLTSLYSSCRLSVAPLRFGAGVKGKVVTSLSYGVPVVATSTAAEGAQLKDGESILIADTPDAFADAILRLYSDAELWQRLSVRGYRAFLDRFSLAAQGAALVTLVEELVAKRRREMRAN